MENLGRLREDEAEKLAAAGLNAYNHNLDTSPAFYGSSISTSTYDRFGQFSNLDLHPEGVPVNSLFAYKSTPRQDENERNAFDFVRMIATARILMPAPMVRLSAGPMEHSDAA